MSDTEDLVVLQFDTVLRGREARALRRLAQMANENRNEPKSESRVALGLLRFLLGEMPEEHNCIIGVKSTRKPHAQAWGDKNGGTK